VFTSVLIKRLYSTQRKIQFSNRESLKAALPPGGASSSVEGVQRRGKNRGKKSCDHFSDSENMYRGTKQQGAKKGLCESGVSCNLTGGNSCYFSRDLALDLYVVQKRAIGVFWGKGNFSELSKGKSRLLEL